MINISVCCLATSKCLICLNTDAIVENRLNYPTDEREYFRCCNTFVQSIRNSDECQGNRAHRIPKRYEKYPSIRGSREEKNPFPESSLPRFSSTLTRCYCESRAYAHPAAAGVRRVSGEISLQSTPDPRNFTRTPAVPPPTTSLDFNCYRRKSRSRARGKVP